MAYYTDSDLSYLADSLIHDSPPDTHWDDIMSALKYLRDGYEERIAQPQAQLAEQPVEEPARAAPQTAG